MNPLPVFALFSALLPVCASAQAPRPTDVMVNGRIESQSASLNAIVNECAVRSGNLYDAIEKAGAEIQKLRSELEALKKPVKE